MIKGLNQLAATTGICRTILCSWLKGRDIGAKTPGGHWRFTDDDVKRVREEYFLWRSNSTKGKISGGVAGLLPEERAVAALALLAKSGTRKKH